MLASESSDIQFVDAREDRIIIYSQATSEEATFQYKIKAASKGKFRIPGAFAEDMYRPNIKSLDTGGVIAVEAL